MALKGQVTLYSMHLNIVDLQVVVGGLQCAAKVPTLHCNLANEPDPILSVRRHLKECQLMSRLGEHKNIVKFIGVCFLSNSKVPALVIEKVSGPGTLHRFLKNQGLANGTIELNVKRHILQGVANGMHYLHFESNLAVVHMDLKASVVLLTSSYDAKITGFRKSCTVHDDIKASDSRYDPVYMPPEVIGDTDVRCSPSMDIYSFGVVSLFTLTQVRTLPSHQF